MAKDLYVPVTLRGHRLEAKASLGQTVIVTEGPETYTGPYEVEPTGEDIVLPTKNKLMSNDVTVLGDEWDGILYPFDEDGRFNCKWLYLNAGDMVICEWNGRNRQFDFAKNSGSYKSENRGENPVNINIAGKNYDGEWVFAHTRWQTEPVAGPCILILAGYSGVTDGTHSANDGYVFFGEYYKYKVIHAE